MNLSRLASLPVLVIAGVPAMLGVACAGVATPPDPAPAYADHSCHFDRALDRFISGPDLSETAIERWWLNVTAEAAALFHGTDVSSEDRREFFDRHVFTEYPMLVVGDDAFLLAEGFALAIAGACIDTGNRAGAMRWIEQAEPTVAVRRCRDSLESERSGTL